METIPTVAVFDFDNTMTTRDSLVPFLFYVAGPWKTLWKLLLLTPWLLGFLLKISSRQEVKERILTSFFNGISLAELQRLGTTYANYGLDQYVRPAALERLKWHQQNGHRCILISASVDAYLDAWTKRHRFHDLICSELDTDANGIVTGRLKGDNCWGAEKKRRLIELLGPKSQYELYAYGDSRGDHELLDMADHRFYRFFA